MKNLLKKLLQNCNLFKGKANAFTLAEVLITLGIIGVVAALTIPNLIAHYNEKVTATKLKETYAVLSQAFLMARSANGDPTQWNIVGLNSVEGSQNIYNAISPYLQISKNCGQDEGCFASGYYHEKNGKTNYSVIDKGFLNVHKFVLNNGASVYIQTRNADCAEAPMDICSFFGIDINGKNKPNAWGRDLFVFLVTKKGIIPRGASTIDTNTGHGFNANCLPASHAWACAGWVIENENMDYLHCNDLSWDGKRTCK